MKDKLPDTPFGGLIYQKAIGRGTYGAVYAVSDAETSEALVVKRNFVPEIEDDATGELCAPTGVDAVKEADLLFSVRGAPGLVQMRRVFTDPDAFPETINAFHRRMDDTDRTPSHERVMDDGVHFVLERESTDLLRTRVTALGLDAARRALAGLLVGLAGLHDRGIVHADVKPQNVLYSETHGARLCDFGLAVYATDDLPSTCYGLYTAYYRPPELALRVPYSSPADIWAAGATAFELFSVKGRSIGRFMQKTCDKSLDTLACLCNRLPVFGNAALLSQFAAARDIESLARRVDPSVRGRLAGREPTLDDRRAQIGAAIASRLKVGPGGDHLDRVFDGSAEEAAAFCDLAAWMLDPLPSARPTAREALCHPFLAASGVPPPIPFRPLGAAPVEDSLSRRLAYSAVVQLYNGRDFVPWYSHRLMFHVLGLVDRAVGAGVLPRDSSSGSDRRIFGSVYVFAYMFYKMFFDPLISITKWEDFAPPEYAALDIAKAEQQVLRAIPDIGPLYQPGVFEALARRSKRVPQNATRALLRAYGTAKKIPGGTPDAILDYLLPPGGSKRDGV